MALSMASLAEPGSEKTPREKWHYLKRVPATNKNAPDEIHAVLALAVSANEKDVDTIHFKECMDDIELKGKALSDSQEFSDVGNVSIMIDNKNIVETCITDLKADIENDVKELNDELNSAYEAVVGYHNDKQVDYNTAAKEEATKNNTSGTPRCEEIPE